MISVTPSPVPTSTQYSVPTTGQTVTVSVFGSAEALVLLNPAGTLATLTVNFPSAQNGQQITVASTQAITALTLGGGTINGAITTLAANAFASYAFSSTANAWIRIG